MLGEPQTPPPPAPLQLQQDVCSAARGLRSGEGPQSQQPSRKKPEWPGIRPLRVLVLKPDSQERPCLGKLLYEEKQDPTSVATGNKPRHDPNGFYVALCRGGGVNVVFATNSEERGMVVDFREKAWGI